MRLKLIGMVVVCVAGAAWVMHAQGTPQDSMQDEIQVGSRPWTPPANTIRVESNVVEVGVVVRDKSGKPIGGLKKEDFKVFDEGKPQAISQFAEEDATSSQVISKPGEATNTPGLAPVARQTNFVAMLFDDINLTPTDFMNARNAAEKLVDTGLEPNDRVAVLTVSQGAVQEFTDDRTKLHAALLKITPHYVRPDQGSTACPRITPYQAYLIRQFNQEHSDALDLAIAQATVCHSSCQGRDMVQCLDGIAENVLDLAERNSRAAMQEVQNAMNYLVEMRGRRVLMLTSSGFLTQTLGAEQDKLIQDALRKNIVVNSLDAKGLVVDASGGDPADGPPIVLSARNDLQAYSDRLRSMTREVMDDPMAVIAVGTGGRFFHNSNDLSGGLRQLVETPEVTYFLGFAPEKVVNDGKYHRLSVKLADSKGETIEARKGYFAPAKEKAPAATATSKQDALNREVSANDHVADIQTEISAQPGKAESGAQQVKVAVHVDVSKLPYQRKGDRSVERLILVTALFDPNGGFLIGQETVMNLNLKDATRADLAAKGIDARLSLQVANGSYRLRSVVQEEATGRMAAISKEIQIQ